MSARQLARLRSLVEEKKKEQEREQENAAAEEEEEEECYEEKPRVSFTSFAISDDDDEEEEEEESSSSESESESEEVIEEAAPTAEEKEKEEDEFLDQLVEEAKQNEANFHDEEEETDHMYINLGKVLNINSNKFNDEKEMQQKYGDDNEDAAGRDQRARHRNARRQMPSSAVKTSLFTSDPSNLSRSPSVLGGGFNIEPNETPFNFDRGSLTHFDNHAVFYSMQMSEEYKRRIDEYHSVKASARMEGADQVLFQYFQKHPTFLPVVYDVKMDYFYNAQLLLYVTMHKSIDDIYFFIRQALFIIEKAVGMRFDWNSGQSRILYSEPENRVIYSVLHLFVMLCIRKSCYETALNVSSLLYSFFPQADPTASLLLIPFIAVSGKRFATVVKMVDAGVTLGPLSLLLLPNWSFDYALCLFRLGDVENAKIQLRESLVNWPQVMRRFIETSSMSLYVSSTVREHKLFNFATEDATVNFFLDVFIAREVQLWSKSECWSLLVECFNEVVGEYDEASFQEAQETLVDSYQALERFLDGIAEIADIPDTILTIDPRSVTEDLPPVDWNDIMRFGEGELFEEQVAEQLEHMRVPGNVDLDHNWLQLMIETLLPNVNINELNDDDVAAVREQLMEMIEHGANVREADEGEGEWEEDWQSDEEYFVC